MPVHRQKKDATPNPPSSTREQTVPPLPDQQTFQQYLRELARGAIRKGYRNGHYARDLVIVTGRLEEIKVPRDRAGQFHTQAFERYSRDVPHIAEGRDGDVRVRHEHATSVGDVAQTLMGIARSRQYDQLPQPNTHATMRKPGASVLLRNIGTSCIWMACISAFAMGRKPILPSF